jgi:hypothetical protein
MRRQLSSFPLRAQGGSSRGRFSSADDASDFNDPYSDLSLFLSQKIKREMKGAGCGKKWSSRVQEELLRAVLPEFQQRFPQHRLGVSALRKVWDRVSYYSAQIQTHKEALTQEGKLNTSFFIRENLRQSHLLAPSSTLPRFHIAHQVAAKIGECVAVVDGVRPNLEELTRTVWAAQRHLIAGPLSKSPYDERDKIDKLIVKTILEITAKDPLISHKELAHQVKETLLSLHDMPLLSSMDQVASTVSALLADTLYHQSALHFSLPSHQKDGIHTFIRRQLTLCKMLSPSPPLVETVRRILALYTLASQLPKDVPQETIRTAIRASYPVCQEERPSLPQAVYAFISAELVLMRNDCYCHSVDYVVRSIAQAYEEALHLPVLHGKDLELLEVAAWKMAGDAEGLLERLPYRIGQKMEEEIARALIDNPHQSFSGIVHQTVQFFKRTKELSQQKKWEEIDRKIYLWTIQGDMLCRTIRLDGESSLMRLITEKWNARRPEHRRLSHKEFIGDIVQTYLGKYPELAPYTPQTTLRATILYKYLWYTRFAQPEESSMDRFLDWHASNALATSPHLSKEELQTQLADICKKSLPLTPFPPA